MKGKIDALKKLALRAGFSHVGDLRVDTIEVRQDVRDACAVNKCRAYGTNWSCPPACGTLEECEDRIRRFTRGIILQTTGELEDSLDYESMERTGKAHREHLRSFVEQIKSFYPDALVIGSGPCGHCETCTYPDETCRFPEAMISSMEALGMYVSDVCRKNDLPYYYGPHTITYTGCVLVT
jgi:predicted metal-binding protein